MITLLRRCHHLFKKIERVRLIVRMITGRLGKYGKIKIIFLKVIENLLFTKNLVEKKNHFKHHHPSDISLSVSQTYQT